MRLIDKTVRVLTPGGERHRRERASAQKAAKAQAELAEAETKVAGEQAAALARAPDEDEAHREADLEEVAEKEAEALPWDRPAGP
jgi:hypothetical protein